MQILVMYLYDFPEMYITYILQSLWRYPQYIDYIPALLLFFMINGTLFFFQEVILSA